MAEVHPGSFVGDSIEEFKKLPTGGKIVAGVALLGVIGLALYERSKSGATTAPGVASPSTDTQAAQQSGAMIGNVPVIPPGYSSIYNPTTGTLEGYQPTPPPTTTTTSGTTSGTTKTTTTTSGLPSGYPRPLIPYSQTWSGKHYFPVSPGGVFSYQGAKYFITGNTNGYITGVPGATTAQQAAGKGQVLLYAPSAAYNAPTGGGPDSGPSIVQHAGTNGATQAPSPRIASGNTIQTGIRTQGEWNGEAHRNRTVKGMLLGG